MRDTVATMDFYRSEPRPLPTVTAETPLDASVTLYLRAGAPTAARDRQRNARARVEALADEGLLPDFGVEEWPSKAVVPNDGPADGAVETYDEFADVVAERPNVHLDPFFEDRPGVGRSDRVVVLPVACIAIRREGALTGLYPCWNEGTHESVEEGLAALESDEDVENLR
jgi:hypothetical protein